MAQPLTFILVSPEKELARVPASSVTLPGAEGELTAMPGHAPFVTLLRPGYVYVRGNAEEQVYAVLGGFSEIASDTVSVLADEAHLLDDLERDILDRKLEMQHDRLDLQDPEAILKQVQYLYDLRTIAKRL
jgi:F-type H+-transporting ATPase subunit epsilon